jgi:hypothetical protein
VAWVSSDTLIVKEVDRTWTEGNVVLFDLREGKGGEQGTIVRKLGKSGEQGDDGWIDQVRRRDVPFFFRSFLRDVTGRYDIPTYHSNEIFIFSFGLPRYRPELGWL